MIGTTAESANGLQIEQERLNTWSGSLVARKWFH